MSSSPKIPRLEELQSPNYSNEEVTKQIIQHLFSLVHSQNCHQQDECAYPDCWKVKNTIEHMATCLEVKSCQTSLCVSSKNILKHWHECTQRDCPVCSPLRKDNSESKPDFISLKQRYLKKCDFKEEKLQAAADPQDSTLDQSGPSTAREGATGGTGASSNAKDPLQPSSTDGSRIFDYALDEDPNIGTRCELPDLHKIWHKSFKQHHSEARKIYKKKNQPDGVYYPSCVIETLRKSNALNMIFGQGNCLGISSLNQQLALTLISYLCYRRGAETQQQTQQCTHTSCISIKNNLRHVDKCEDGTSCTTPHCQATRKLIEHWKRCLNSNCPVCPFVKKIKIFD